MRKSISEFYQSRNSKNGASVWCKECEVKYHREYYQKNKEKLGKIKRKWRARNRDRAIEYSRQYHQKHRIEQNIKRREYYEKYEKNNEELKKRLKQYRQEHKEKFREKGKQYYWKHRKECLEKTKRYYEGHREKTSARKAAYYQRHKVEYLERKRRWEKTPSGKIYKKRSYERRQALLQQCKIRDFTSNQRRLLIASAEFCTICEKKFSWRRKKFVCYIIPLSHGGNYTFSNMRVLCESCNWKNREALRRATTPDPTSFQPA